MTAAIPAVLPDQAAQQDAAIADAVAAGVSRPRPVRSGHAQPRIWLLAAAAGLGVLAGAAAAVSYAVQYRLVYASRHLAVAAALEAAIPDALAPRADLNAGSARTALRRAVLAAQNGER
jgi:hypothetical protein